MEVGGQKANFSHASPRLGEGGGRLFSSKLKRGSRVGVIPDDTGVLGDGGRGEKSKEMSFSLLQAGLLRVLESFYDRDYPRLFRDHDKWGASKVVGQPKPELTVQPTPDLTILLYSLLKAIATHCDLRDCSLLEELGADIRYYPRQTSERYFGVFWCT